LVIDVVDSFANKSLVTIPSLLGLDPEFRFEGAQPEPKYSSCRRRLANRFLMHQVHY